MRKLSILALLLLAGCDAHITPNVIEKGNTLCEPNQGMASISKYAGDTNYYFSCNNGAQFTVLPEEV